MVLVIRMLTVAIETQLVMFILTSKPPGLTFTILTIDELPDRSYVDLGDINLGALFGITNYSRDKLCGTGMNFPPLQQYVEAVVFAVNEINHNNQLLPNITLGFAILDDCGKQNTAFEQSHRFLPRKNGALDCSNGKDDKCKEFAAQYNKTAKFDVVGIIGPLRSENNIAVSLLMATARLPQVSFLSTSDELSHKEMYTYFLRVVPPDEQQVRAILTFIRSQGWTYISVIYSDGSYGEHAYNSFKEMTTEMDICIAVSYKIADAVENDYTDSVNSLMKFPRARVVVAFLEGSDMVGVFAAVEKLQASQMFIWVGSDGWAEKITLLTDTSKEALLGSFTTLSYVPPVPEFDEYFRSIKPSSTKNPWFHEFWERQFNCSFNNRTCDESADIASSRGFHPMAMISSVIDTVYTYAHAIQNLINNLCPGATGKKARNCIKGDDLLEYLKNVSFEGYSGHVNFDAQGNMKGRYVVSQIALDDPLKQIPVRVIDATTDSVDIIKVNNISWELFQPIPDEFPPDAVMPPPPIPLEEDNIPVSVCSSLCGIGQFKIFKEEPCCWDCRSCRDNEIVVSNQTACQICPIFHWPERRTNFTTCREIVPDYPIFTDTVVIFETCTSCVGILAAIGVLITYVLYREARIIKAASRELSFLQLFAIGIGYITMLVYVAPPTQNMCAIAYWLFCFSFDLLYAPLLVKAIRIYRIFNSALHGTRGLRLVSPLSQVVISCIIVMGQVLISILVTGLERPTAILTQPVRSEAFVELSCDITLPGLASFLAYNLTLVILCSIFAFKTRKLPDNFNESRFMSMCVATTLVIWLAFIPTFLTSSRQYLKTLLLTLALLLNHSVALVFLFVSKLYAAVYLQNDVQDATAATAGRSNGALRIRSRTEFAFNNSANMNIDQESLENQT